MVLRNDAYIFTLRLDAFQNDILVPVPGPGVNITLSGLNALHALFAVRIGHAAAAAGRGGGFAQGRWAGLRTCQLVDAVGGTDSVDAVAVQQRVTI